MKTRNLATVVLLALALICPVRVSAHPGAQPRAQSEISVPKSSSPRPPARGSRSEDLRYAEREKSSPDAKKYRAGDTLVITATAAIILLLGVIIIILIT